MAISIYGEGAQPVSTPDMWDVQEVTGPGVFAALFDLQHHNGLEVRVAWISDDAVTAEPCFAWSLHRTIDNTSLDDSLTILTPPVPVVTAGRLRFEHVSGTPGALNVPWVVYQL